MIELLCIESHPEGAVIAGNTYPLLSNKPPCKYIHRVDVGIRTMYSKQNNLMKIGEPILCTKCNSVISFDGIWWMASRRFVQIAIEQEVQHQELETSL